MHMEAIVPTHMSGNTALTEYRWATKEQIV